MDSLSSKKMSNCKRLAKANSHLTVFGMSSMSSPVMTPENRIKGKSLRNVTLSRIRLSLMKKSKFSLNGEWFYFADIRQFPCV